mmetsp:Transcript_91008/g.160473  ORF Transcript_91008/g.160473 Transcript_91008/m.160473 type:complete len:175 (+) Transcript_91008:93-617(+)
MRVVAFALACLACSGLAKEVQLPDTELPEGAEALAGLLRAFNPAASPFATPAAPQRELLSPRVARQSDPMMYKGIKITRDMAKHDKRLYRRTKYNKTQKRRMRTAIRKTVKAIKAKDAPLAKENLNEAYKYIDLAVRRGPIHRNSGARKKSKLALKVRALLDEASAPPAPAPAE